VIQRHAGACRASEYNEIATHRGLIASFFKALGWDIGNKARCAKAYKDMVQEGAIEIGDATRAPTMPY